MNRVDAFQLRQTIASEEFDYGILSHALSAYSGVRQKIHDLLKAKVIVRVKKGLYVFGPDYHRGPICKEALANLVYGPSCISLESALAYHGLIPERVEGTMSVTPNRDKLFQTPVGGFNYRYLGMEKYPHGIEQIWVDDRHPVLMASPEKALCDYLVLNRVPEFADREEAQEFLLSDLRIDQEHWKRLKPMALHQLNRHYRSENVDRILEVL